MTNECKVGDKVILSAVGMVAYGDGDDFNPWFTIGTIEEPSRELMEGFMFYVKWSNGYGNAYQPEDLQVIQC